MLIKPSLNTWPHIETFESITTIAPNIKSRTQTPPLTTSKIQATTQMVHAPTAVTIIKKDFEWKIADV